MLFDRSIASFTYNIIYIDYLNNYKTWLVVVCTIFCFLKITSFLTPHNSFKTLPLSSKLQRENEKKSCLKYSIYCCFPTCSPASFLSRSLSGKPTQAYTSGFSYQTKIYRTCATKCPSATLRRSSADINSKPCSQGSFLPPLRKDLGNEVGKISGRER